MAEYDGYERLEWKHSYARVYTPSGRYEPQGVFMSFEHYNVEVRDRVKCISGMEGKCYNIAFDLTMFSLQKCRDLVDKSVASQTVSSSYLQKPHLMGFPMHILYDYELRAAASA